MNYSTKAIAGTAATAAQEPEEKLSAHNLRLDQLSGDFHDYGSRLERLADRLLGSQPQNVGSNDKVPEPHCVLAKMQQSTEYLQGAAHRIGQAMARLEAL